MLPHFTDCFDFTTAQLFICICVFTTSSSTLIDFSLWLEELIMVGHFLGSLVESDNDLTWYSRSAIDDRICSIVLALGRIPLENWVAIWTPSNTVNGFKLHEASLLLYLRWVEESLSCFYLSVCMHQVADVVYQDHHDLDSEYQVEGHQIVKTCPV